MKRKWHRFVRSLGLALAVAAVMVPTAAANVPGESGDSRPAAAAAISGDEQASEQGRVEGSMYAPRPNVPVAGSERASERWRDYASRYAPEPTLPVTAGVGIESDSAPRAVSTDGRGSGSPTPALAVALVIVAAMVMFATLARRREKPLSV